MLVNKSSESKASSAREGLVRIELRGVVRIEVRGEGRRN